VAGHKTANVEHHDIAHDVADTLTDTTRAEIIHWSWLAEILEHANDARLIVDYLAVVANEIDHMNPQLAGPKHDKVATNLDDPHCQQYAGLTWGSDHDDLSLLQFVRPQRTTDFSLDAHAVATV
jgi:hypothetical protein